MDIDYQRVEFPYVRSADQDARAPARHPVIVVGAERARDGVQLDLDTPEGRYALQADYVVACDGARSPVRALIGEESKGRTFHDRFLIADVKMEAEFPSERRYWFDPPFHRNQS